MRRFWFFLLALVLSLQWSWAAGHVCAADGQVALQATEHASHGHGSHSGHEGHGGHGGPAANDAVDDSSGHPADRCCSAAHGCCSITFIGHEADADFALGPSSDAPVFAGDPLPLADVLSRVERPKWSAA